MLLTDLSQKIVDWLCVPTHRASRHFLEANMSILAQESDLILHNLFTQYSETPTEQQRLAAHLELLGEIRTRGSTVTAIREAYVDLYGGLTLDLPPWLEAVEDRLNQLSALEPTERTSTVYKLLLRDAIKRMRYDERVEPEIRAELQCLLADALLQDTQLHSRSLLKTAMSSYQESLQIYISDRYLRQYSRIHAVIIAKKLYCGP